MKPRAIPAIAIVALAISGCLKEEWEGDEYAQQFISADRQEATLFPVREFGL